MAALTAGALVAAGPARAQDGPDLAAAKEWFKEGVAAEQAGDCKTAVEAFLKAISVKETPQMLLRVGRCQKQLGELAAAHATFSRARELAASSNATKVLELAQGSLSEVDPLVPRLTIAAAEPYEGLVVTLDGEALPADALERERLVDPGSHVLTASADGREPYEKTFDLAEGAKESVRIELAASVVDAPPPPPPPEESDMPSIPGLVLVVGGGLLVGGGVVSFIVAEGKSSDIDAACGGDRDDCPGKSEEEKQALLDDVGTVDTLRALGIGLGVVGIGAAAVGVWFLLTDDGGAEGEAEALTVVPVIAPGVAGITATQRF